MPAHGSDSPHSCGKIFVATLLVLLIVRFVGMAAYREAAHSYEIMGVQDFGYFYHAAVNLREGRGIYLTEKFGYVYTPLVAIAMQPLARLPLQTAFRIWTVGQILCILAAAGLCAWALCGGRELGIRLPLMILMGFRFWPTDQNIFGGQSNFLMMLLLAGMILAGARNRLFVVALLIAIAGLCKTWMFGMVLYLLVQKSWRAALSCLIVFATGVIILFTCVGWSQFASFLQANHALKQTGMPASSIPGFAKAYLMPNEFIHPLLNSSAAYYGFLVLAHSIVIAGLIFVAKLSAARTPYETSLRIGVVTMSILLALPICNSAYVVFCLPTLWTLVTGPLQASSRGRTALAVGGAVIYLSLTFPLPSLPFVPHGYEAGWRSLLLSGYFYAIVLLWTLALAGIYAEQRAARNRGDHGR